MKKILLSVFTFLTLCLSANAEVKECNLSALPAASEETTWEAATNTFAWTQTYYNSTEVFKAGDYSGYDTFNFDVEAGTADHFRIIIRFSNGATQVTHMTSVGKKSITWEELGVAAENVKSISSIRISGANDCLGNIKVNKIYLDTTPVPTPYTVNAKVTADGMSKTFEGQTLKVVNGAEGELTVTLPEAKAAGYSMESQSVKVKLDGETLSMVEGQTVNFSFGSTPVVVTVTDVTGTIVDDEINVIVNGQGDNGKAVTVAYTTPLPADAKEITWPDGSKHNVRPAVTMKVDVDGETDRTFSFGSYQDMAFYAVDFGDGNLVITDTIKATTGSATKTAAHGVALGEGNITIYASKPSDVWYFSTSTGGVKASPITSIDLTKLTNVHQMNIGGTNLETMDLSACDSLRNFTAAMGSFTSMDFSNNPELTSINMVNNKLASINVSKNAKLDQLTIYENELTELDLTANPALTGLYAYSNKLTSVKFAEGAELKTINLQKNQLASIELPTIVGSTSLLYLNDNQLTELTVPSSVATFEAQNNKLTKISLVDCTKSCKLENNCFTIATLPAKPASLNTASKIKKFTYAPQAPLAVEESVDGSIDLSAQLTAMGELTEEATTEYTVVDAEGNELTADDDYKVENGVISFKEKFNNIRVVMTSAAFPKATGANAFTTTTFNVSNGATSINALSLGAKNTEAMFNLSGVKMAAPAKGIIIKAGKKFYVK